MPLPTCQCNAGLPIQQQLANIYCALLAIEQGGSSGPTQAQLIAAGALIYGEIRSYAGDPTQASPPPGWAYCNGQSLLRAGPYAPLFSKIGTTYGAIDGSHFSLPDLQGRVTAGVEVTTDLLEISIGNPGNFPTGDLGATGGEAAHVLTGSEAPGLQGIPVTHISDDATPANTSYGLPGDAHNTIQPTMLMNKIIFTGV